MGTKAREVAQRDTLFMIRRYVTTFYVAQRDGKRTRNVDVIANSNPFSREPLHQLHDSHDYSNVNKRYVHLRYFSESVDNPIIEDCKESRKILGSRGVTIHFEQNRTDRKW